MESEERHRRLLAGLVLRGNTYEHRLQIMALGGLWDPGLHAWLMPDVQACEELGAQYAANRQGEGWWLRDYPPRHKARHQQKVSRRKPPTYMGNDGRAHRR